MQNNNTIILDVQSPDFIQQKSYCSISGTKYNGCSKLSVFAKFAARLIYAFSFVNEKEIINLLSILF